MHSRQPGVKNNSPPMSTIKVDGPQECIPVNNARVVVTAVGVVDGRVGDDASGRIKTIRETNTLISYPVDKGTQWEELCYYYYYYHYYHYYH